MCSACNQTALMLRGLRVLVARTRSFVTLFFSFFFNDLLRNETSFKSREREKKVNLWILEQINLCVT